MKKLSLLLFIICTFIVSCKYNGDSMQKSEIEEYKYEGFSLKCPKKIVINKKTPVEDFNIYDFIYDGHIILSAYVGNQPNFYDNVPVTAKVEKGIVNGLIFESVIAMKPDGTETKNVLIKFSDRRSWPNYIHFWYSTSSPEIKNIVEQIISSIEEI